MKLKNIFLGICALIAFTACSNDDGPEIPEGKVALSVRVASKAVTKTDDPHELPGEANLNNLTALVFSEDGSKLLGGKKVLLKNVAYEYELKDIWVNFKEPVKARIVILANTPDNINESISSYDALYDTLAELADQKQENLTMSTPVITTSDYLSFGYNYIGYDSEENINGINEPLWLTRLPARLEVAAVSTKFTKDILLGRTVTINSIYFDNVRTQSRYFSVADWGVVQAGAMDRSRVIAPVGLVIDNDHPVDDLNYLNYVMENLGSENPTGIVVSATLSATDKYSAETRLFRANINNKGVTGTIQGIDISHRYVKRNFVYRVTMAFGNDAFDGDTETDPNPPGPGPGPGPEPRTTLDVRVEVVGWGEVEQPVVID